MPDPTRKAASTAAPIDRRLAWRRLAICFAIAGLLAAADLGTKAWSFAHVASEPVDLSGLGDVPGHALIPPHDPITVIPRVLSLKLTLNEGAVFGLGQGGRWVFIAVTFVAVGVVGYLLWTADPRDRWLHLALLLILAGAMGNLHDRVWHGAVRDMFWLLPGVRLPFGWTWPGGVRDAYPWIFNLADAYLMVGVGLLAIRALWPGQGPSAHPAGEANPADPDAGR